MHKSLIVKELYKLARELTAEETIRFERNGIKAKMKRDAKTKKGVEFKKNEEVTLNWLEKMPEFTFIIKTSGERLRVNSKIAHALVTMVNAPPTERQFEKWSEDSRSKSMLGESVEPDGFDPHGSPSWMLVMGVI